MKKLLVVVLLLILYCTTNSQTERNFEDTMKLYQDYFEANQFNKAIDILEKSLAEFPDKQYEISKELAIAYGHIGMYEKSFKIWKEGFRKGLFYCIIPQWDIYKAFKNIPAFKEIYETDKILRGKAIENSSIRCDIIEPINYNNTKEYPLLIVLHGGGSSNKISMKHWKSNYLSEKFIVAFLQSYLPYDMTSFGWSWDNLEQNQN